jgi:hypothetical protein
LLESSIWIRYEVAPLTSDQSKVAGNATVAPPAGLRREGAAGAAGFTVNVAVRVAPPAEPEMVTGVEPVTEPVVIVNVRLVKPAFTLTLAGTVAAVELSRSSHPTARLS